MHLWQLWRARFIIATATLLTTIPFASADSRVLLLIPDWTGDRVCLFNAADGALVDANFIVDPSRLNSPKNAIFSGRNTILVSDQVNDAIHEYDLNGTFVGTIANQASGADNVRGIAMHQGQLYATIGDNIYANSVQKYNLNGSRIGTFVASPLNSPFDIYFRDEDALVSNFASHHIERFSHGGAYLGRFVDATAVGSIRAPQQITRRSNGNLLVAGFSQPAGVFEYDPDGNFVAYYNVGTGVRGVYELRNGRILFTANQLVATFMPDPNNLQIQTIYTQGNFQYVDSITIIVEGDVNGDGCVNDADILMILFAFGDSGVGLDEDLNDDGVVNDQDLLIVLFNFGVGC